MIHSIEIRENFEPLDQTCHVVVDQALLAQHPYFFKNIHPRHKLVISDPERAKSMDGVLQVLEFFFQLNLERQESVYVVGGGALSDLVGFCASIFKRGLGLVLIPTTLLAMVDAAIGGKNGINFKGVKNLIGTFYQPKSVVYYPHFLKTLPHQELLSGLAEGLKIGLICHKVLWERLDLDHLSLDDIKTCAKLKLEVVAQDPMDQNVRQALNFGHSFAHAYELLAKLPHGWAVACGMIVEARISYNRGVLSFDEYSQIKQKITDLYGLFQKVPFDLMRPLLKQDKKNCQGGLKVTILANIGQLPSVEVVSFDEMFQACEQVWM